jgi:hypothetical protein
MADSLIEISDDNGSVAILLTDDGPYGSLMYRRAETSDAGATFDEREFSVKAMDGSRPASKIVIEVLKDGQTGTGNAKPQTVAFIVFVTSLEHEATATK